MEIAGRDDKETTMITTFYRIQPPGMSLSHTSETSEGERLDDGYLFAYTSVGEVLWAMREWGRPYWMDAEVVIFSGNDSYDAGDVEGLAVLPGEIIARTAYRDFVYGHGTADDIALYEGI